MEFLYLKIIKQFWLIKATVLNVVPVLKTVLVDLIAVISGVGRAYAIIKGFLTGNETNCC
jgi:hypothetical protein